MGAGGGGLGAGRGKASRRHGDAQLCRSVLHPTLAPSHLRPPLEPSSPASFCVFAPVDWVRDVAWAPNFGLPMATLASAGQDGKVVIWSERQEGEHAGHSLAVFAAGRTGRAKG